MIVDLLRRSLQAMDAATSPLQQALHWLTETGNGGAPAVRIIDIPWASQLGKDAAYSNSDCGPACVTMWLRWLGKAVTVDQVSKATGLPQGYKYTMPANLMLAAKAHGLNIGRAFNITLASLRAAIDAGAPAIVLVHYASLPESKRFDPKFTSGHWVLVVGHTIDAGDVIYHDPYWPDTRGQMVRVTAAEFERAMRDCGIDGNTPNQALMLKAAG